MRELGAALLASSSMLVGVILRADVIVLVWLGITGVGLVLALDALAYAIRDRRLVSAARDADQANRELELECEIVRGDVVGAWWVVTIEASFLAAGLLAAVTPQPSSGRSTVGWVLVVLLIAGATALPAWLLGRRNRRRRILEGRLA